MSGHQRSGGGDGIDGERSGLWREMARIVSEVRPRYVFVENSPLLVGRGLAVVLGDLADMGYDAQWFRLSASDCGAPHQRDRAWIVAHAAGERRSEGRAESERREGRPSPPVSSASAADSDRLRQLQPQGRERDEWRRAGNSGDATDLAHGHGHGHGPQRMVAEPQPRNDGRQAGLLGGAGIFSAWPADPADAPESRVGRVVDGMAHRAHRIKALGNGQVPICAAMAFRLLAGGNQ